MFHCRYQFIFSISKGCCFFLFTTFKATFTPLYVKVRKCAFWACTFKTLSFMSSYTSFCDYFLASQRKNVWPLNLRCLLNQVKL